MDVLKIFYRKPGVFPQVKIKMYGEGEILHDETNFH